MTTKEEDVLIGEFIEALSSRVFQRGYNEGVKDGQERLNDVWECVEKFGQLTIREIYEIFGVKYDNIYDIIADYTPLEFIKAIKEYEET